MNRIVRKVTERRGKSNDKDSLVKGGLTPTVQRRELSPELRPGELWRDTQDVPYSRRSSYDTSSRPLMTQPVSLRVNLPSWEVTPGLLGIYNHGNTCFMNTILQCLSNTDVVSEYFVKKRYKEILNVKGIAKKLVGNSRGEVTEHLGYLFESLWSGEYTPDVSNHLKSVCSKYNVQYKGSSQHDAQEFLLWLLDRINEELHHSPKKKAKDTMKKKDKHQNDLTTATSPEMVLTMASGFEIYNRFQALYQSSLTCPNCDKQSNTYETYLCLSLPVPQKNTRPVYMTVVYLDDNPKQLKIALEMDVLDTIRELRDKLAYELEVPPKRLILCQVYDDGFRNTYGDDQLLSDIHESETVFVFETYPFSEVSKAPSSYELIQILLVHVERISLTKIFCTPDVIRIPRDITYTDLQKYILKSMGLAVSEDVIEQTSRYETAIFDIRVMDSGTSDSYLSTDVDMPLYTQEIDRALQTYSECEDYGPPHVKFVIEWDTKMKERIVDNDEDIYEEHQSIHKVRLSQQQPTHVSLDECLKLFTKEERLGEGDAWHCTYCNKDQQGTIKKLGLWSAPDLLVIHLKRFRHCGLRRNKLNILVNFPVTDLDMSQHMLPRDNSNHDSISDLYDLYGVSNHYGNMSGGHYTAFCKNPIDNRWYEYDDTNVKPLPNKEIVSRAAYLLFYQRKKLTNMTLDSLHANTHWIFDVYVPPRSPREVEYEISEDGYKYECDMVDGRKVSHEKDSKFENNDYLSQHFVEHTRRKSEPYQRRPGEINSPRREDSDRGVSSPRSDETQNININSPRQSVRNQNKESPRRELYVNLDQVSRRDNGSTQDVGHRPEKVSVADQILRSTGALSQDQPDSFRRLPKVPDYSSEREARVGYRRTDSVDSSKHSPSYTSSSDTSQGEISSQSSPLEVYTQKPPLAISDQTYKNNIRSNSAVTQNNVLNNERSVSETIGINPANNVKLKIHANQIHKDQGPIKASKPFDLQSTIKTNQKVTNTISNMNQNIKPVAPIRREMFSTPQQPRKSPTPPVQNGRGPWSTPQPQRKQYSNSGETRPQMDRQMSAPVRQRPLSSYDGRNVRSLEIQGHSMLDEQPRSLPLDSDRILKSNAEKPPLPSKQASRSNIGSSTILKDSRVPAYTDTRPSSGHESHARNQDVRDRERYDTDVRHNTPDSIEVRRRNRSVERNYDNNRRSVRGNDRPERPTSYHQSSYNDFDYDQYYLTQPTENTNFDRTSKYATMRPSRHEQYMDEDARYMARQIADQQYMHDQNIIHQPRSRAPINYNPTRYQDRSRAEIPRFQPHLHPAKFMSNLTIKERDRELQQKMKNQYLKESSV